MKIQDKTAAPTTFDEFATKNSLVLEMHERFNTEPSTQYYCHFTGTSIREDDGFIVGKSGNGATKSQAIADYARKLRGALLVVVDEPGTDRRKIQCPNEWAPEESKICPSSCD